LPNALFCFWVSRPVTRNSTVTPRMMAIFVVICDAVWKAHNCVRPAPSRVPSYTCPMSANVLPPTSDFVFKLLFGDEYEQIHRVICVCITSKPLFLEVREYLNRFRFCNMDNGLCFEGMPEEIYTLELSKVPVGDDGTGWWEWVRFLLARTEEEIEMLTQGNSEIRKAADALYVLSADPEVRAKYEMHEKASRDRISQIAAAERKVRSEWQAVVADKDAENERLRAENEVLRARLKN